MANDATVRSQALEAPSAIADVEDDGPGTGRSEEMPRSGLTRRRVVLFVIFIASAVAFLYFVLPKIAGLKDSWQRIEEGDPWWLVAGLIFESLSFLGYVLLFRGVYVRGETRLDWRESYQITMAGVAATRLFAAGGAGGLALTAWALRRSGLEAKIVACRMVAFMVLLYLVYMASLVIVGVGLYLGILAGGQDFAITIVPAILGAVTIIVFLGVSFLPAGFERRARGWSEGRGPLARLAGKLAAAPASLATGTRTAIDLVRARNPLTLGAVMWWAFDILTLWAAFRAFGDAPAGGVIVMSYFVGMLGNLLPLPGGIGGVDGGMIGAFAAFGVNPGLAIVAVLAYRAFAFWLPTIPGALAYLQLRRTVHRWSNDPAVA
jgi:putative heme transporter